LAERRRVPKEEYDREVEELRRLREEIDAKWKRLRSVVTRVRFWESRIATLETRLAELRRIGWVYLRAPERREWLEIRDRRLPEARARHLMWSDERESIVIEIRRQRIEITRLEAAIALKIVVVKELAQVKLVIFSIVEAVPPKRPYTKRFQCMYNVDALRDPITGEIDYTAPLTAKELETITADFYKRWGWMALPSGASPPEIAETGELELVDNVKGATIKEMSVREEEEETYRERFVPPVSIYEATDEEKDDMKKYVTGEKKTPKQIKEEEEKRR